MFRKFYHIYYKVKDSSIGANAQSHDLSLIDGCAAGFSWAYAFTPVAIAMSVYKRRFWAAAAFIGLLIGFILIRNALSFAPAVSLLLTFIEIIVAGSLAATIIEYNFRKKGFRYGGVIMGDNLDHAIQRYIKTNFQK